MGHQLFGRVAEAQKINIGVLYGELCQPVRHPFRPPFRRALLLDAAPQLNNIVDVNALRRRRVGRTEMSVGA